MIEERSVRVKRVKAPGEPKVERTNRGTGGLGGGERH